MSLLLGHDDDRGFAVTGLVVLVADLNPAAAGLTRMLTELSRALAEMSDVTVLYLE